MHTGEGYVFLPLDRCRRALLATLAGTLSAQQPGTPPKRPTLVAQVGHTGFINAVTLAPNGKCMATASADKTAKLWEYTTGKELRTFLGHTGPVTSVAFTSDSKVLITGSEDKTIRVWEVATGRELHVFREPFWLRQRRGRAGRSGSADPLAGQCQRRQDGTALGPQ